MISVPSAILPIVLGWELTQKAITGHYSEGRMEGGRERSKEGEEKREMETKTEREGERKCGLRTVHKWGVFIKTLSSGFTELAEERAERFKSHRIWVSPRKRCLPEKKGQIPR